MKCMNVLSLFDGLSGAQIALERAGLLVENYFSCEIDKYAIKVAQANYPNTIQIGNIIDVNCSDLPEIDLLIGGSPCQGFSFAGKQLNFDDPRSKLFFEYVRVLKACKPKHFLLENVMMKKEFRDVISEYLGVQPVMINSSLVSAQNRKRLYWANFPIEQPEDKGIMLKDVVFDDALFDLAYQFPHGGTKGGIRNFDKSPTVTRQLHNNVFPVCMRNLYGGFNEKEHRTFLDKSPTIRTVAGGGHIPSLLLSKEAIAYMGREVKGGRTHWDFKHHSDIRYNKSTTIVTNFFNGIPYNVLKDWNCIRKFHPVEVERLQTIPDNYTDHVSDTQRYKMIGNGFTIDVVAHILTHIMGNSPDTEMQS